jgi:hypothetical protein
MPTVNLPRHLYFLLRLLPIPQLLPSLKPGWCWKDGHRCPAQQESLTHVLWLVPPSFAALLACKLSTLGRYNTILWNGYLHLPPAVRTNCTFSYLMVVVQVSLSIP